LFSRREELRFEVKLSFTGLRVKRHRAMLVRNYPIAVDLAVANGRPPPHFEFFSVDLCSADPVETVTESQVFAGGNLEIPDLVSDRSIE